MALMARATRTSNPRNSRSVEAIWHLPEYQIIVSMDRP